MSRSGLLYSNVVDDDIDLTTDNEPTYTFDDAMDEIGFGRYNILLMQVIGAGYFFDGMELGLTSFMVPMLIIEWNISYVMGGALASVVFLGMGIGAYLGGLIADRFGRKIVFCGSVFLVSCFGTLSAFAPNYGTLITLRSLVGISLGSMPPTDYSMLFEYSPKSSRGLALGALQVYGSIGGIVQCLLAWACLTEGNFSPGQGWRWLLGLSAAPGFIIFILRLFVRESPRHMLINGRYDEARELLTEIAHYNGKKTPKGNLIATHTDHKLSMREQFVGIFGWSYIRLTLLLWFIWFLLSYGGWGYSYLSPIAFDKLGTNPFLGSLSGAVVGLFGNILIMLFMDRIPRKPMLIGGFILSGILTAVAGVTTNPYYVITMISVVSFTSSIPWSAIYVYTTEAYPTVFRASGMGSSSVFYRIGATITPLIGSWLLTTGYVLPYVTFGVSLICAGLLSIFLPFETYGRQVEDVPQENTLPHAKLLKTGVEEDIVKIGSPEEDAENGYHEYAEENDRL